MTEIMTSQRDIDRHDRDGISTTWISGMTIRVMVRGLFAMAAAVCLCQLALAQRASAATTVCEHGATVGHCTEPLGVAADFETGNVYVADRGNNRIDVFQSDGTEVGMPSSISVTDPAWVAVDNIATSLSRHDIYVTTAASTIKKFEPNGILADEFGEHGDGTPEGCQLEDSDDSIAVGPNGDVYVLDVYEHPGPGEIFTNRIVKFDDTGNCVGQVLSKEGQKDEAYFRDVAVDSTGVIYINDPGTGVIRQYDAAGTLVRELEGSETVSLAVDASDRLFTEAGNVNVAHPQVIHFFTEYESAADGGAVSHRFDYAPGAAFEGASGLAALHTIHGDLFASEPASGVVRYIQSPTPGPVQFPEPCHTKGGALGSVRATLLGEVNPEGKATTVKAEYATQVEWEADGFGGSGAKSTEVALGGVADFELHEEAVKVEPLEPETVYHCRIVASNTDGSVIGEEGSFKTTLPFEFGSVWAADVGQTSATINAEGNPEGAPATAQVEYVGDAGYQASGFAGALSAPVSSMDYGSGEEMVLRDVTLTDLQPGTLYHYRLRARDAARPEGIVCPGSAESCPESEHTFRTYTSGSPTPDHRRYELVSPGDKNGADVAGPINTRGLIIDNVVEITAGAPSGEAVTYTSWSSFGQAQGAPATSQYLSKRDPSGWVTENVSPGGLQTQIVIPPYLGFSSDLRFGVTEATEDSLAVGCPAGRENLYVHEADTGMLRCLTPEVPQTSSKFGSCFTFAGASDDGSRVFFQSGASYDGAPVGAGVNLYEWHEGQIHVISILPGQNAPVTPTADTSVGARNSERCQTGETILHHAVSGDGSKVIWTYMPLGAFEQSHAPEPSQLLDRVNGSETVQLDRVQSGAGKPGNGLYWAASEDGSVVYFTSPNRLISGAKAESGSEDLYRYDFNASPQLTDLTSGGSKGLVPGGVKGVLGAGDDGSIVYFVASAALTPSGETNQAGEHAETGQDNLYVYDATQSKTSFIARLSGEDRDDWETQPTLLSARVSADGRHLAFLTSEAQALVGYDDTLSNDATGRFAGGGHCRIDVTVSHGQASGSSQCPQAFIYDETSAKLTCASCNPTGSRPLGSALLTSWTGVAEGPRFLSDDGRRLFFESFDRLSDGDENDKRDVYEFEFAGSGTCTDSSPAFDPASDGCHYLISSGHSQDESFFIDASTEGRDVFFSTRSPLVGWDTDEHYDVYNYREGGGFPEPATPTPPCTTGETCKSPAVPSQSVLAPATSTFNGPGNPPLSGPPAPKPSVKSLPRGQKLARALRVCRGKHVKAKRRACERQARKRYGPIRVSRSKSNFHKGGK